MGVWGYREEDVPVRLFDRATSISLRYRSVTLKKKDKKKKKKKTEKKPSHPVSRSFRLLSVLRTIYAITEHFFARFYIAATPTSAPPVTLEKK